MPMMKPKVKASPIVLMFKTCRKMALVMVLMMVQSNGPMMKIGFGFSCGLYSRPRDVA